MARYLSTPNGQTVWVGQIVDVIDEEIMVRRTGHGDELVDPDKVRPTKRHKLVKVNPTTVKIEDEDGKPFTAHRLTVAGLSKDQSWESDLPVLKEGMAFRFTDGALRGGKNLHVITKVGSDGRAHSAPFGGGDEGRRINVHASVVEIVDVRSILEQLA